MIDTYLANLMTDKYDILNRSLLKPRFEKANEANFKKIITQGPNVNIKRLKSYGTTNQHTSDRSVDNPTSGALLKAQKIS